MPRLINAKMYHLSVWLTFNSTYVLSQVFQAPLVLMYFSLHFTKYKFWTCIYLLKHVGIRLCTLYCVHMCTLCSTFCRRPRQSRDMARLAKREKASFWIVLLSGATPEASFITECIRELPREHLGPDAIPGPPAQRVLHAERRKKKKGLQILEGRFQKYSGCARANKGSLKHQQSYNITYRQQQSYSLTQQIWLRWKVLKELLSPDHDRVFD